MNNELYNCILDINERYYLTQDNEIAIKDKLEFMKKSHNKLWTLLSRLDSDELAFIFSKYLPRYETFLHENKLIKNISEDYAESILDKIVYGIRKNLPVKSYKEKTFETHLWCRYASAMGFALAKNYDDLQLLTISLADLGLRVFDHVFDLVIYEGNYYIIDCTYSQFLTLYDSCGEVLLIPNCVNADSGFYLNNLNSELLESLLKKGWFKIEKNNLKDYLDSFVISSRNGFYYLNKNQDLNKTEFTSNDYIEMLNLAIKGKTIDVSYGNTSELGTSNKRFSQDESVEIEKKLRKLNK